MNSLNITLLLPLLKNIYATFLRSLIKDLIDNPETPYDEVVLSILDNLLGYGGD